MAIALHGGYVVPVLPNPQARPNKLARGMTKTLYRKKAQIQGQPKIDDDVLRLTVKGTVDRLGAGFIFLVTRRPCSCCNAKQHGKLMLNEKGALRLRSLRRKRNKA